MEQQEEFAKYRIFIFRAYQYESMNLLNQGKADLAITVSKDLRSPALLRELKERGLEYHTICELPACVRLSKNHPLTKEPSGLFQKLKDYPFVNYTTRLERVSSYNRFPETQFINLSKLIYVDAGEARTHIISKSNAYGVGCVLSAAWAEEHGLCCVPIPNFSMELGVMRRSGEPQSTLEQWSMEFLQEVLRFLKEEFQKEEPT